MEIIENFAALSEQEQKAFAEALIKTINSESTFSSETDFKLLEIEADEMTGGLYIKTITTSPIEARCKASWTAADKDDAYSEPYGADFITNTYDEVKKSFNTEDAVIDGYAVTLNEIYDIDEKFTDAEVDSITDEDGGIGPYEFWGELGYDSSEYVEVTGTLVYDCTCTIFFYVEPAGEAPVEEPEEE